MSSVSIHEMVAGTQLTSSLDFTVLDNRYEFIFILT